MEDQKKVGPLGHTLAENDVKYRTTEKQKAKPYNFIVKSKKNL